MKNVNSYKNRDAKVCICVYEDILKYLVILCTVFIFLIKAHIFYFIYIFIPAGLCLHQCKLPAEQYFADTLGLPLTVSPNFETQECQWSFGEVPLDPADDPTFPRGCLVGCPSRGLLKEQELAVGNGNGNGQNRDLCSAVM